MEYAAGGNGHKKLENSNIGIGLMTSEARE
jgi:hypothetical protein